MIKNTIILSFLIAVPAFAGTVGISKDTGSNNVVPGSSSTASFNIPSGATLTINSGATINNLGTNTGFTVPWSGITSTPTTIIGYGITDGVTLTGTQTLTNKILMNPTLNGTLSGSAFGLKVPLALSSEINTIDGLLTVGANYVGTAYNIIVLSDSQANQDVSSLTAIGNSYPGWLASMSFAQNSIVYNLSQPGQSLETILSSFDAGIVPITGCATITGTSTITLSGTTGISNGMAISGPGIPVNAAIYYSGTGTAATLYSGTRATRIASVSFSGPFLFKSTSGSNIITWDGTPSGFNIAIPPNGSEISGPGIPDQTYLVNISGSNWTLTQASSTTNSSDVTGYAGTQLLATATGTNITINFSPLIPNGNNTFYSYTAQPGNGADAYLGVSKFLGHAATGASTIWFIHAGNHTYVEGASNLLSATSVGTSSITGISPALTSSAWVGAYVFANNGTYYGTVSANGTTTATITPTVNPVTGATPTAIPAAALTDLVFNPTSSLSIFQTSYTNLVNKTLATGTGNTDTWTFCETLQPVYAPIPNDQAYCAGMRQLVNAWIRLTYGGSIVPGVYVQDDALLPKFQTFDTNYLNASDGTHPTTLGAQYIANFHNSTLGSIFAPVSNAAIFSRDGIPSAMLSPNVALTNGGQTFTNGMTVMGGLGVTNFGLQNSSGKADIALDYTIHGQGKIYANKLIPAGGQTNFELGGIDGFTATSLPTSFDMDNTVGSNTPGSQANLKFELYGGAGIGIGYDTAGIFELQNQSNGFAWYHGDPAISGMQTAALSNTGTLTLAGSLSLPGDTNHLLYSNGNPASQSQINTLLGLDTGTSSQVRSGIGTYLSTTGTGSVVLSSTAINPITVQTGTLTSGTSTKTVPSGCHPWVQDNATSLTNVGSLVVTVSGTIATITSTNVLDTSPFTLFNAGGQ